MNQRPSQLTRFRVMAAMALAVLAIYLVVLFNTQVVHHEEYLAKSIQTITRMENVEASRGIITDRSGRTLVTNQSTYSLTFDASLLKPGENQNDAILRLVTLCRDQGVAWEDNLPLSLDGAAHFTVDTLTDTQKSRFFSYLRDLKPTRELLAAYAKRRKAHVVVKGLRAVSDFEQEVQMAVINRKLNPRLETMFLASSDKYTYLSSTVVKEMARYGADLGEFVPREIVDDVDRKMRQAQEKEND